MDEHISHRTTSSCDMHNPDRVQCFLTTFCVVALFQSLPTEEVYFPVEKMAKFLFHTHMVKQTPVRLRCKSDQYVQITVRAKVIAQNGAEGDIASAAPHPRKRPGERALARMRAASLIFSGSGDFVDFALEELDVAVDAAAAETGGLPDGVESGDGAVLGVENAAFEVGFHASEALDLFFVPKGGHVVGAGDGEFLEGDLLVEDLPGILAGGLADLFDEVTGVGVADKGQGAEAFSARIAPEGGPGGTRLRPEASTTASARAS